VSDKTKKVDVFHFYFLVFWPSILNLIVFFLSREFNYVFFFFVSLVLLPVHTTFLGLHSVLTPRLCVVLERQQKKGSRKYIVCNYSFSGSSFPPRLAKVTWVRRYSNIHRWSDLPMSCEWPKSSNLSNTVLSGWNRLDCSTQFSSFSWWAGRAVCRCTFSEFLRFRIRLLSLSSTVWARTKALSTSNRGLWSGRWRENWTACSWISTIRGPDRRFCRRSTAPSLIPSASGVCKTHRAEERKRFGPSRRSEASTSLKERAILCLQCS